MRLFLLALMLFANFSFAGGYGRYASAIPSREIIEKRLQSFPPYSLLETSSGDSLLISEPSKSAPLSVTPVIHSSTRFEENYIDDIYERLSKTYRDTYLIRYFKLESELYYHQLKLDELNSNLNYLMEHYGQSIKF